MPLRHCVWSQWYLTQGAVPSRKGPAVAYLQPFVSGAWSLLGAGSLVTFQQRDVLGAGLLTAKHTARLESRAAVDGEALPGMPLVHVKTTAATDGSAYTVRVGEGANTKDVLFDAVIVNSDADVVSDKVMPLAGGVLSRWALAMVQYAPASFSLHSEVPQDVAAARAHAAPARPSVFYSGTTTIGQVWDGSGSGSASGTVTVDASTPAIPTTTPREDVERLLAVAGVCADRAVVHAWFVDDPGFRCCRGVH